VKDATSFPPAQTLTAMDTSSVEKSPHDTDSENGSPGPALDSAPATPAFPEGGLQAWLTVLGGWLVQFCAFGYSTSFGVYQDFYVREYLSNKSSSQISWIGSVQLLLLLSTGFFTGRAFDRGYFYHLVIAGSLLFAFSLFMLSLAKPHQYYQVFLAQGIGMGISIGLIYVPAISVVSHYFSTRRAIAMGIAASGSSVGALIHPIMLNHLFNNPSVGFANGVRASAGLNTVLLLIACLLMRTRLPPKKAGNANLFAAALAFSHDSAYVFAVSALVCAIVGFFFPIFYLQLNAVSHGIDPSLAFYLVALTNGVSIFGRIIPVFFVQRFGAINLLTISVYGCAIMMFTWYGINSTAGFVIFAIIFGFFAGSLVTLVAPVYSSLAQDFSEIGARIGIAYTFIGISGLIGSPIGGALLSSNMAWWRPTTFAGVCMACGGTLCLVARAIVARRKGRWQV